MKTLTHGQAVKIQGKRGMMYGTFGTVRGYALEYKQDPDAAEAREKELMKTDSMAQLVWANQKAACLCADPGFYERETKWRESATLLIDGEIITAEGKQYAVKIMGDYSDFIHFNEVK